MRFKHIVDLDISSDGRMVAVELCLPDRESDTRLNEIWLIDADSGQRARVGQGGKSARKPRFSPDGRQVAFLSNVQHPWAAELFTCDLAGQTNRRVAGLPRGILDYAWSPDGSAFALTGGPEYPPDRYRGQPATPEQARTWYLSRARVVNRLKYQWDGRGLLDSELPRVWICAADGAGLRQLTDGSVEASRPRWTPDGHVGYLAEYPERELGRPDVACAVDPRTGVSREVWQDGRDILSYAYGASGSLAAIAEGQRDMPYNCQLRLFLDGRNMTASLDRTVTGRVGAETEAMVTDPLDPVWTPDGSAVLFQVSNRDSVYVYRLEVATGALSRVLDGARTIATFAVGGGRIAFATSSDFEPLSIRIANADGSGERILWQPNDWLQGVRLGTLVPFSVQAEGWEVDAWVLQPPEGVARKGAIVLVHGGPQSAFGHTFSMMRQLPAAAGYTVLYCNPPGSEGREEAFMHALIGRGGELDLRFQEALVDRARELGLIGDEMPGVMGVSYGGYVVLWAAAHSQRFAAAVASRPFSNFQSKYGDDWSWRYTKTNLGAEPWEDPELFRRLSVVNDAPKITIPLRMVVGMGDRRTPPEQAQQVYTVLKKLGRPVDMVLMPDAPHYQHAGHPWHRVFEIEATIDFFDQHLARGS